MPLQVNWRPAIIIPHTLSARGCKVTAQVKYSDNDQDIR